MSGYPEADKGTGQKDKAVTACCGYHEAQEVIALTDREKAIKGLEDIVEFFKTMSVIEDRCNELKQDAENAIVLLKEQPEIVRCISCTFYRSDGECALHNGKWRPEGFCSGAIRKEGQ